MLPRTVIDYRPQPLPPDEYNSLHHTKKRPLGSGVELDQSLFSAKKERSKVFTGRRNTNLRATVPSLYECAIRVLCDNIDGLGYTGGVPYEILKPVLERATPEQLFRIEDLNPYLCEETDSLWEALCKRDFKDIDREELESWREVYERLLEQREIKLEKVKHAIGANKKAQGPARQTIMAQPTAPKNVRRKQEKFGTGRQQVMSAKDVLNHRRAIDAQPSSKKPSSTGSMGATSSSSSSGSGSGSTLTGGGRPLSSGSSGHSSFEIGGGRKRKTVAPLMAKTLKMLKMARR